METGGRRREGGGGGGGGGRRGEGEDVYNIETETEGLKQS